MKVLLNSFHLNGDKFKLGFYPQNTATFIDSRLDSGSEKVTLCFHSKLIQLLSKNILCMGLRSDPAMIFHITDKRQSFDLYNYISLPFQMKYKIILFASLMTSLSRTI